MEFGALFILIIFLGVFAVVGGGVYAIATRLRHKELDPEEDKLKGPEQAGQQRRPEHVELENEQRTRFVGS